jgi:signal transduction histidine kinase
MRSALPRQAASFAGRGALLFGRTVRLGWMSVLTGVLAVLVASQLAIGVVQSFGLLPLAIAASVLATLASYRGIATYIRTADRHQSELLDAARLHGVTLAVNTIRHHLGNKLGVVVGYSELLADDLRLPADAREQATKVLSSAMAAAEVVRKLDRQLTGVQLDTRVVGTRVLDLDAVEGPVSPL